MEGCGLFVIRREEGSKSNGGSCFLKHTLSFPFSLGAFMDYDIPSVVGWEGGSCKFSLWGL